MIDGGGLCDFLGHSQEGEGGGPAVLLLRISRLTEESENPRSIAGRLGLRDSGEPLNGVGELAHVRVDPRQREDERIDGMGAVTGCRGRLDGLAGEALCGDRVALLLPKVRELGEGATPNPARRSAPENEGQLLFGFGPAAADPFASRFPDELCVREWGTLGRGSASQGQREKGDNGDHGLRGCRARERSHRPSPWRTKPAP
ncbi:MAG: hypothetical protein JNK60_17045 [Acidobacteria bacterium]|nr:hypothetical protein [Acidobacteriota bacterium]